MKKKIFSRTVIYISLVSLCNDISSEMLIPVLPLFLKSIGYTALFIGVLEGCAEAVSGISRIWFVRVGYSMSAIGKSMMVLFANPLWIFSSRSMDRLGKGVRTAARDALLADESTEENRGKVYGFNKAFDTIGAGLGVFIAFTYLYYNPLQYKNLFLFAILPSIVAVGITFFINDSNQIPVIKKKIPTLIQSLSYWKYASANYKKLIVGLLLFAIFNASDAFILLIGKQHNMSDSQILLTYIFYNIVFALSAIPFGYLADKCGMKFTFLIGLAFFGIAYGLFSIESTTIYIIAFIVYGFYSALTDGIAKAWLSKYCNKDEKATAMGFFSGMHSIVILFSNILAGIIWVQFSSSALFIFSAIGAFIVAIYFLINLKKE